MKLKLNLIILIGLMLLSINFVDATLPGTYKKGECVNIKTILNSSAVNISTISYPNSSTYLITNMPMSLTGKTFNYSFCNTTDSGSYFYDYFDIEGNVYVNDFEVTDNGKEKPSGAVIVFLGFFFLIIVGVSGFLFISVLDGFRDYDFTGRDVIYNWSAFFLLLGVYLLNEQYLGNDVINNFLLGTIKITSFTLMFLPLVVFLISMIKGQEKKARRLAKEI